MDIETTPKARVHDEGSTDSRLSSLGRRHTPTARMSERKRNLFEKKYNQLALIIDDDVDLGPMSPLQYSSSPNDEAHSVPFDRNAKQTDFSNLFPGSLKPSACLSPINSLGSPMFSTEKQQLVIEESASSTVISLQSNPQFQVAGGVVAGETTNIPEEETQSSISRRAQEKTPGERMINCADLRVSFKKSLILGDMMDDDDRTLKNHQKRSYSTSVLAEKNHSSGSKSPQEKIQKLDTSDASRARTSLTFEGVGIPTNRFYAHHNEENKDPAPRAKRYSLPALPVAREKRNSSGHRRRSRENGVSKKGCGHKIKKPVRVPGAKEALKKRVELAVLEDQKELERQEKEKLSIDDAQTTRIHEILKNIKNPLEMSRPLFFSDKPDEDRFIVTEEDEEEGDNDKNKRKFFKSGSKGAKSYKLTNNVVATVEGGRITLPKFPSISSPPSTVSSKAITPNDTPDAAEFSMMEEEGEFGSEFEEVTGIISKLTSDDEMDGFRNRIPYNTVDAKEAEKQSELLEMLITHGLCTEENFTIFIAEPDQHKDEMNRVMDSLVAVQPQKETKENATKSGLFPIFYNRPQVKRKLVALGEQKTSPSRKVWKRIGDTQMQIDAGQRRFGATYCAECDLLYSVHEPEDELMHERFHQSLAVLKFNGWKQENVVAEKLNWGLSGRVIAVAWNDHKAKVLRVNGVLDVVNREMGCPAMEWKSKMTVYLAVAQNTILGVCVAESKYEANRLVTESGVDYFSEENYPVWCGISRIWVAAPYRNQGVASELVTAARVHFTIGRTLSIEEVAFQSPTEAGKLLGQKLTNRKDFLVYP